MIRIVLALLLVASSPSLAAQSKIEDADRQLLAAGRNVFVERSEHDIDMAMLGELKKWNRWKIVADESEADLLVRMRVSGSATWGIGHVQASILDAKTKRTLYISNEQRGLRTVFHGYASPYSRAISGIVKQMAKDTDTSKTKIDPPK
jgi:hypothetical protein